MLCPLLNLRKDGIAEREERGFRQILYATDFSVDSLAAAPYALAFSGDYSSRLTLVHALEGLPESPYVNAQMAMVRLRGHTQHHRRDGIASRCHFKDS